MHTLLFIHGFATSPEVWGLQVQELSKEYKIITVPEKIKEEQRVFVIGWSAGAFEAVKFYFEHRERVRALILVSATPKFLKSNDYFYGLSPAFLRNLERKLKADFNLGLQFFYNLMFMGKEPHPLIARLPIPGREATFRHLNGLRSIDMRSSLAKIEVPVLLIHGDEDQICLPEAAKYMHERIPKSELRVFPKVGHVPFLEDAHNFNLCVRNFITKHEY